MFSRIDFSNIFDKQLKRAPSKVVVSFRTRLEIFTKDPNNGILNNHTLKGSYSRYRSINITGDWRALYSLKHVEKGKPIVIFEILGTHSQLYK